MQSVKLDGETRPKRVSQCPPSVTSKWTFKPSGGRAFLKARPETFGQSLVEIDIENTKVLRHHLPGGISGKQVPSCVLRVQYVVRGRFKQRSPTSPLKQGDTVTSSTEEKEGIIQDDVGTYAELVWEHSWVQASPSFQLDGCLEIQNRNFPIGDGRHVRDRAHLDTCSICINIWKEKCPQPSNSFSHSSVQVPPELLRLPTQSELLLLVILGASGFGAGASEASGSQHIFAQPSGGRCGDHLSLVTHHRLTMGTWDSW